MRIISSILQTCILLTACASALPSAQNPEILNDGDPYDRRPNCHYRVFPPAGKAAVLSDEDCENAISLVKRDFPENAPTQFYRWASLPWEVFKYKEEVPYIRRSGSCMVIIDIGQTEVKYPAYVIPSEDVIKALEFIREKCVTPMKRPSLGGDREFGHDGSGFWARLTLNEQMAMSNARESSNVTFSGSMGHLDTGEEAKEDTHAVVVD